ncbi:hypothetical protein [Nostoc sp.]|uniref:hypothetical protein n=1 Tax=Nostoc sp. TaxID=1180 RepID=UPI002FF64C62
MPPPRYRKALTPAISFLLKLLSTSKPNSQGSSKSDFSRLLRTGSLPTASGYSDRFALILH